MEPANQHTQSHSTGSAEHDSQERLAVDRPTADKPKATPLELLRNNWIPLTGLLVLLVAGGLFLWLRSATQAAQQQKEVVAAASENIEPEIKAAPTEPTAPVSPSAQIEQQRRLEQEAQSTPVRPNTDEVVEAFVADTLGQALRRKRRAAAATLTARRRQEEARLAAADVDTIETTLQDPTTGSYHAQTLVVPRRRPGQAVGASARRASYRAGRGLRAGLLPATDIDGTPFETDPDVLAMLGSSPPETRAAYERMTGKRFRDPKAAAQTLANRANAAGRDGFNTVKVGNSARMMAQGSQAELTPDVFFKCVINGEQKVRTGSVVLLRLQEDAVVSGVTFPKNSVFAGIASVGTNNVMLEVNRLGPTRVAASIYDYNYLPGIMIDPVKRVAKDASLAGQDLQQQSMQEVSTAIDRSASAANSVVGVGGRVAMNVLSRPKTRTKLREVLLPDGYPILITTAAAGQLGPATASGR
ncbi:conjugative transposon protein TraM [Hymenobacter sp. BT175]|uniref:conjugative transposon protein TraM n=1 Tax=Hymenobacter translucens TaxID=2886507 RepID=UPI001D0E53C6|nr:conjugative transposon protein TraM [Hymenobacter translucens]MCC2548782.1 conjugative transposon protein TraM [Hymenobacter translucens]